MRGAPASDYTQGVHPLKKLRILLAEDDEIIAMLLGEILCDLGHEVCATETTEAGTIAAAARDRPDVMLIDVNLAGGSGVAAVGQVLQGGHVPHVFMTGDTPRRMSNGTEMLFKPFGQGELVRAIERATAAPVPPGLTACSTADRC